MTTDPSAMQTDGVPTQIPAPSTLLGRILAAPIRAYRRWLSPVLGPRCRFYPSCSEYALIAISRHGAVRGTLLTVWRLLRCQPFHPGGIDHVPPARSGRLERHERGWLEVVPRGDERRDRVTGAITR